VIDPLLPCAGPLGKQRAAFQMASRAVMTRDPRTLADALPLWQVPRSGGGLWPGRAGLSFRLARSV